MNLLFLGDVVGDPGLAMVEKHLPALRRSRGVDFCLANCENTARGLGVNRRALRRLQKAGVDAFTAGNHVWDHEEGEILLRDESLPLVRPANYPPGTPGRGYRILDVSTATGRCRLLILNLLGRLFLTKLDCPFRAADRVLAAEAGNYDAVFVDFHAEATAEKRALGFHLAGRVAAVVGTHTHVMTRDEEILPGGTAYISDVGMTGPRLSVIGVSPGPVLRHFRRREFRSWRVAGQPCLLGAVRVEIAPDGGQAQRIEAILLREPLA